MVNKNSSTGGIEVQAEKLTTITTAKTPPFPLDTPGHDIHEETRMEYRYLDLRRDRMRYNMQKRFEFISEIRAYLTHEQFIEIETPILTKSTPEGARDFLVPSRLQKGTFYALPQSPQQYKQLLMVAGFERYFQIARCFRDEDPRKDRAYGEFTQLDMEMSFVSQDDILHLVERMFTTIIKKVFPKKTITFSPWPRIPHADALKKYGSDKPDLRKDPKNPDELAFAWIVDFPLFTQQSQEDFYHGSGAAAFAPSHHMFTSPHPDDIPLLDTNPTKARGLQHDLALNGFEVGGGSIRIHDPKVQQKIFDLIGFSEKQKREFNHMLKAFSYGVPPHGGIAPGIDRLLMALLGEPSVREVIAFPAVSSGKTAVMDAPNSVSPRQLTEVGIRVNET
jgi:aspartyl-tRNA synthetase